ncbi:hypothetical protein EF513_00820 [Rickettsiales endosymbiont of Stachyamoeba lipophora]|nr:hypothetical protein EF513_00820 [Rickettsiales endosymbiont of Stachyamoeba lipophora]
MDLYILYRLFCTALALVFLIKSLKVLSATKISILTMIEPVITILTGVLLLDEIMSKEQIVGITLILLSSLITSLSTRFKRKKSIV